MNGQKNQQIFSDHNDLIENSDLMRKKSFVNIIIYILIATLIISIFTVLFQMVLEFKYQQMARAAINGEQCLKYYHTYLNIGSIIDWFIIILFFINIGLFLYGWFLIFSVKLTKRLNIKLSKIFLMIILSTINLIIIFFIFIIINFKVETAWCVTT